MLSDGLVEREAHSFHEVVESTIRSGSHGSHKLLHGCFCFSSVHLPVADDMGFWDVSGSSVVWVPDGVFHLSAMALGCALGVLLRLTVVLLVRVVGSWTVAGLLGLVNTSLWAGKVGSTRRSWKKTQSLWERGMPSLNFKPRLELKGTRTF